MQLKAYKYQRANFILNSNNRRLHRHTDSEFTESNMTAQVSPSKLRKGHEKNTHKKREREYIEYAKDAHSTKHIESQNYIYHHSKRHSNIKLNVRKSIHFFFCFFFIFFCFFYFVFFYLFFFAFNLWRGMVISCDVI